LEEVQADLKKVQRNLDRTQLFVGKLKGCIESLVWNFKECVPDEHLTETMVQKYRNMVPDHQLHINEVRILSTDGLTDMNNILDVIAKDMKHVVDENYTGFYYTDYQKIMGERKKIIQIPYEEVWDKENQEMLDRLQRKNDNLKT
jgi:hypothetical protein